MASKNIYLIDTENVGTLWKELLIRKNNEDQLLLFYTEHSPNVSYVDLQTILKYPDAFEMIRCNTGKNGLDFQLVSYLGYLLRDTSETNYIIVSNDYGFDPVVRFWQDRGIPVSRSNAAAILHPKQNPKAVISPSEQLPFSLPAEAQGNSAAADNTDIAEVSAADAAEAETAPSIAAADSISTATYRRRGRRSGRRSGNRYNSNAERAAAFNSLGSVILPISTLPAADLSAGQSVSAETEGSSVSEKNTAASGILDRNAVPEAAQTDAAETANTDNVKSEAEPAVIELPAAEHTVDTAAVSNAAAEAPAPKRRGRKKAADTDSQTALPATAADEQSDESRTEAAAKKAPARASRKRRTTANTELPAELADSNLTDSSSAAPAELTPPAKKRGRKPSVKAAAETGDAITEENKRNTKEAKPETEKKDSKAGDIENSTAPAAKTRTRRKSVKKTASAQESPNAEQIETIVPPAETVSVPAADPAALQQPEGKAAAGNNPAPAVVSGHFVLKYLPEEYCEEQDTLNAISDILFDIDITDLQLVHRKFVKFFGDEKGTNIYKAFRPHLAELYMQ